LERLGFVTLFKGRIPWNELLQCGIKYKRLYFFKVELMFICINNQEIQMTIKPAFMTTSPSKQTFTDFTNKLKQMGQALKDAGAKKAFSVDAVNTDREKWFFRLNWQVLEDSVYVAEMFQPPASGNEADLTPYPWVSGMSFDPKKELFSNLAQVTYREMGLHVGKAKVAMAKEAVMVPS
jgi:hypothetical protein